MLSAEKVNRFQVKHICVQIHSRYNILSLSFQLCSFTAGATAFFSSSLFRIVLTFRYDDVYACNPIMIKIYCVKAHTHLLLFKMENSLFSFPHSTLMSTLGGGSVLLYILWYTASRTVIFCLHFFDILFFRK